MWLKMYVTGSRKTSLIAHDSKFDFSPQTQSYLNTLSSFTVSQPGLNGLFLPAVFLKPSGKLCKQSGALIDLANLHGDGYIYVAVHV